MDTVVVSLLLLAEGELLSMGSVGAGTAEQSWPVVYENLRSQVPPALVHSTANANLGQVLLLREAGSVKLYSVLDTFTCSVTHPEVVPAK
jgi:hypothetical protein